MAYAKIGSVSAGTHREQDLLPRFLGTLWELDRDRAEELKQQVPAEAFNDDEHPFWDSEEVAYLLEELFDLLNDYAPEGCYFGAHPGDGADFGFWQIED